MYNFSFKITKFRCHNVFNISHHYFNFINNSYYGIKDIIEIQKIKLNEDMERWILILYRYEREAEDKSYKKCIKQV